ncbi:MAG: hypothetical protein KDJ88_22170 [Bauldia sp.]|nr:hypothetical protein [Bauldia sp.]
MRELRFDRSFLGGIAVAIVVADLLVALYGLAFGFHKIAREDGPIETVQLIMLALAGGGFLVLIPRLRHGARIVVSGAAAICIMFFFREFETPVHNAVLDFMSHDGFLWILAAALGVFLAIQIHLNWAHVPAFLGWLVRLEWWPWIVGGSILLISSVFEAMHMEVIEELLELNADVVFALIAFTALARTFGTARAHMPAWHAH